MTKRGGVPKQKVRRKEDQVENLASSFIMYMELCDSALNYLKVKKRLSEQHRFRLIIERNFCFNALLNIFKVSRAWIKGVQDTIHSEPAKFMKEVEAFSDAIAPEKPTLITKNLDRAMSEVMASRGREKQIKTGGNLLIKP